jgi:hypothetical protein
LKFDPCGETSFNSKNPPLQWGHFEKAIAFLPYVSVHRRAILAHLGLGRLGAFLARHLRKRAACLLKSGSISRPVRQPLATWISDSNGRTFPIGKAEGDTVIIAEIKFREIAMQVLLSAMLIDGTVTLIGNLQTKGPWP